MGGQATCLIPILFHLFKASECLLIQAHKVLVGVDACACTVGDFQDGQAVVVAVVADSIFEECALVLVLDEEERFVDMRIQCGQPNQIEDHLYEVVYRVIPFCIASEGEVFDSLQL
jgi:hypothetical protein